jgi:hypothetical protein
MVLVRLCGLPVVLLSLALLACGSSRRGLIDVQPADEEKKQEKDDKKEKEKGKFRDLGDIHAEVTVLQVLHALDLSEDQLKLVADLADKTAQKPPARKEIRASEQYRKTLIDLRAALRGGKDEKIDKAMEALDEIRGKEEPEYEEIELTDAARKQAPVLFAKLSSRQVVFYLSGLGDAFPDPVERMLEALEQARKLDGKDWQHCRDDVAFHVGSLIGGLDATREERSREKVTALLDKAHDLTDKQFADRKEQLEKSIRELAGKLGPLDIIRHYVERVLAETLSNHRLAAAVAGRQKGR